MFRQFEHNYDKEALLKIYEKHADSPFLDRGEFQQLEFPEIIGYAPIIQLFEDFGEIFGATHPNSVSFIKMVRNGGPHIPHGHNGMIIFPIKGTSKISFYSYTAPIVDGRPTFTGSSLQPQPEKYLELLGSKTQQIAVDKPTAYNGLVIHSHSKADEEQPVFVALKIPTHIEWNDVLNSIDNLGK